MEMLTCKQTRVEIRFRLSELVSTERRVWGGASTFEFSGHMMRTLTDNEPDTGLLQSSATGDSCRPSESL